MTVVLGGLADVLGIGRAFGIALPMLLLALLILHRVARPRVTVPA